MKIAIIHNVKSYGGSIMGLMDVVKMLHNENITIYMSRKACEKAKHSVYSCGKNVIEYDKEPQTFSHFSGISALRRPGFWHGWLCALNNTWWLGELKNYDIVLLNSSVLAPLGAYLTKRGIKSVCYNRETYNMSYGGLLDSIMRRYLSKQTAVLYLSENERKHFKLDVPSYIIPDVFDEERICTDVSRNDMRTRLKIAKDDFVIIFLGGIAPLKGSLHLLKAFELFSNQCTNKHLLVLGKTSGLTDDEYTRECILKINDNPYIHNIGITENVGDYYNAADVLVFPATKAHQARPVFEAGYFRLPAIVSRFSEMHDYCVDGQNILSFEPGNVKDLSDKLEVIFSNSTLRVYLGLNNLEMCEKHHSINYVGNYLVECLYDLNYRTHDLYVK